MTTVGALLATALPSQAIIVGYPGEDDGLDHSEMDPLRAPMVEHVGQLGSGRSGSAVYLGKRWIITANHAFEGRPSDYAVFAGKQYRMNPSRAVRLKNATGSRGTQYTDLVMIPLLDAPDLPPLKINDQTPFTGEVVVLVGCGDTKWSDELTDAQSRAGTVPIPISTAGGPAEGGHPRWGENEVSERDVLVGIPGDRCRTQAFATIRQPHRTEHNAQGAAGDSGGGVFVKRGERWELSGVMLSVFRREEMDASATFIADLSVYREQIEETIPEPSAALLLVAGLAGGLRRRR